MDKRYKITVLVPTYRRPQDLLRCLTALQNQTRSPDEVLVVVRDTDEETWNFLKTYRIELLPLRILIVSVPGVIAAMNLGFETAQGDIISVTDDDAAPHTDWLERIEAHFVADPHLGGLGGRDHIHLNGLQQDPPIHPVRPPVVGQLQWFGRMVGNHHIGEGSVCSVDLLKGVNMSLRRTALGSLRCDERLKGTGAQVHFEAALSLGIQQQGWRLLYDPAVAVDHYLSKRFDEDQRNAFNALACGNIAHNETFILLSYLPPLRRVVYVLWALLVGVRGTPGLVQVLRFLPIERAIVLQRWIVVIQGRWQGWQTWQANRHNDLTKQLNRTVRASL
jgi:glycosyltransferase involved in cell wall biosynthesis